jgi:peptidoglycan-N-acetylglucosamine deacetylase
MGLRSAPSLGARDVPVCMHAQSSLTSAVAPSWRLPLLVKASVGLHAGALLGVVVLPAMWPWALAAVVLNQALLTAAGLWPRSTWLGENMTRLPAAAIARREVAITIDDGPDPEVTPAVLDVLEAHHAKATFFCIAERAARHPELCRRIIESGHSVQNHSQRHSIAFSLLGKAGFRREIGQAQEGIARITGQAPRYFRAPAGLRNPLLAPVLHRLNLQLVSWTRRGFDTVQRDPARVLERLAGSLAAGDIVLLHDGNAAHARSGKPVVLEVLPELLRRCQQAGLRTVTLPEAAR